MSSSAVFRINKLSCSYSHKMEDRVLLVNELEIPRGQIVFLLGASGSGKSTLLETLGLMNDTFADGSIEFFPSDTNELIRLEDLWYAGDSKQLGQVRKNHFSFIFQNTNLMEHFTAYENICVSPMIKKDLKIGESLDRASELMNRVNIPSDEVDYSTLTMHLSGGQRQRVAFVRALMSQSSVLLCDEPTGNLDERNANELMKVISESMTPQKSVIIVSHDIKLAMQFADQIICISKEDGDECSTIQQKNIFRKTQWEALDAEGKTAFKSKVISAYEKVTERTIQVSKKNEAKVDQTEKFAPIFLKKEQAVLNGKGWRNVWVISALMLFSFLAIGFANGALSYLEWKLKNPFVTWLTVSIPSSRTGSSGDVQHIKEMLNRDTNRVALNINAVSGYSEMVLRFSRMDNSSKQVRLRSVSPKNDLILTDILRKENLLAGGGFSDTKDFGLVCTSKLITDLGLNDSSAYVMLERIFYSDGIPETVHVPLPIRGVVRELPGKVDALITDYFFNAYRQAPPNPFDVRKKDDLRFCVEGNEQIANRLVETLNGLSAFNAQSKLDFSINSPKLHDDSRMKGYDVIVDFYGDSISYESIDSIGKMVMTSADVTNLGAPVFRFYQFDSFAEDFSNKYSYDGLSINLSSLDKVRELKDFIYNNFNDEQTTSIVELDVTKVKEKENFNFMSNMTLIICWMLIALSAICIGLFIYNLVKMHLNRVKSTLGTFVAFGLNNRLVIKTYLIIVARTLFISLLIGVGLSFVLGSLIDRALTHYIQVEEGVTYFKLVHWNSLITLLVVVFVAGVVSYRIIKKMLSQTPGDLIYNRV